jgi:hypothetical protein
MSPIPGEPLDQHPQELILGDGRKVKVSVPGLTDPVKPRGTQEDGATDPPPDDPRPPKLPDSGDPAG